MAKFFALLFALIGLSLIGLALALAREHPAMLALGILGAAIVYGAHSVDGRREKIAAEQHDRETKRQIEVLAKEPWKNGRLLAVKTGGKDVLIASLTLAVGALFAYCSVSETETRWGMLVGSVLFSAFVLFALIRILPSVGKPALVLNIRGFQTPLHGIVPWHDVSGINLQRITIRGSTTNTLNFHVENYAQTVTSIHWTERMLGFFGLGVLKRKVIAVMLNGTSEEPETIAAIARLLWQQSTGMNHEWNPLLSNEFNQAARRAHEFMDRYKDPNSSVEDIPKDPDKALKEVEQFRQDINTVNSEQRRNMRKTNWLVAIGLLGLVATLLWPFLRSHISL